MTKKLEAYVEVLHDFMNFHEGSQMPIREGGEDVVIINADDYRFMMTCWKEIRKQTKGLLG